MMKSLLAAILALTPTLAPSLAAAEPPRGGTVAIQARTGDGEYDPALNAFVDAAGAALTDHGFTVLPDPAHAAVVAELILSRDEVGTALTRDPNALKPAIGLGVTVPLSTGASAVTPLRRTRLELRLHGRTSGAEWHAAAVTVRTADARTGSDAATAAALTRALLGAYPEQPTEVIGVP